ncbi:MAG TPA: alcohol dehydrogenase catalytic domain-containing protein, partial [Paraburkholderia sp.]
MRAIRCNQYGPPESLTVEDLPDLEAPPGHVVIDVSAASVNFPDVLIIQNKYQMKPPLPFTPGSEVAGVVRAVGAGVTQFSPGARVVAFTGSGGFAEQAIAS